MTPTTAAGGSGAADPAAGSGLHPHLRALVSREFARLYACQTERSRHDAPSSSAPHAAEHAATAANHSEAASVASSSPSPSSSSSSSVTPLLTLSSLVRLASPPGLPVEFDHLPTLFLLDRCRRGAVSLADLLTFLDTTTSTIRTHRWHTRPWTVRAKIKAHCLKEMYEDMARTETNTTEAESTSPSSSSTGSGTGVSFVQWLLSLLVNNQATSRFVHVGLRVVFLHRESLALLWHLLRPFLPRPPLTAALAAHDALTEEEAVTRVANATAAAAAAAAAGSGTGGVVVASAPLPSFESLCAASPSLSSIGASSALSTHSFQSFFDLLQHAGERAGLLALEDEVLDHFVPLGIVEHALVALEAAMRTTMRRIGFKPAPVEVEAHRKAKVEAAALAAAAAAEAAAVAAAAAAAASQAELKSAKSLPPSTTTSRRTHRAWTRRSISYGVGGGGGGGTSGSPDGGVVGGGGGDLFTLMPLPTPRSFMTPRAANNVNVNVGPPHASPSKRPSFNLPPSPIMDPLGGSGAGGVVGSSVGGGVVGSVVGGGNTHRLRNIAEEPQRSTSALGVIGLANDNDESGVFPVSTNGGVGGAFGNGAAPVRHGLDELRLPLHAIPTIDFTTGFGSALGSGGGSGAHTAKASSSERDTTPELLTPTSSHRGGGGGAFMKRPPGVPSLSFARSDQPASGHIGGGTSGQRSGGGGLNAGLTSPGANNGLGTGHSHSSSVPSISGMSSAASSAPHTALSVASTTLHQPHSAASTASSYYASNAGNGLPSGSCGGGSSAGSSQSNSTAPTPLTSPTRQTYQAHLHAGAPFGPPPPVSTMPGSSPQQHPPNPRRSTGPLPPRFKEMPLMTTSATPLLSPARTATTSTNGTLVPSLPLHALHQAPPGTPQKLPTTTTTSAGTSSPLISSALASPHYASAAYSPATYSHRLSLLQFGAGGGPGTGVSSVGSLNTPLLVGHAQLSTSHRLGATPVYGSSPFTTRGGGGGTAPTFGLGPGLGSAAVPQTPGRAQALPFDGPLPASHASLLSSASKLTSHVHRVHDLAALTTRQVRNLVRDGGENPDEDDDDDDLLLDPDEDDDEQHVLFERSTEEAELTRVNGTNTTMTTTTTTTNTLTKPPLHAMTGRTARSKEVAPTAAVGVSVGLAAHSVARSLALELAAEVVEPKVLKTVTPPPIEVVELHRRHKAATSAVVIPTATATTTTAAQVPPLHPLPPAATSDPQPTTQMPLVALPVKEKEKERPTPAPQSQQQAPEKSHKDATVPPAKSRPTSVVRSSGAGSASSSGKKKKTTGTNSAKANGVPSYSRQNSTSALASVSRSSAAGGAGTPNASTPSPSMTRHSSAAGLAQQALSTATTAGTSSTPAKAPLVATTISSATVHTPSPARASPGLPTRPRDLVVPGGNNVHPFGLSTSPDGEVARKTFIGADTAAAAVDMTKPQIDPDLIAPLPRKTAAAAHADATTPRTPS